MLNSTIQMTLAAFGESWKRSSKVMGWARIESDLWEVKLANIYRGLRE